jgi:D-arabinitol dehydrogenase (NADP+)
MKAIVYSAPREFLFRDVPDPEIAADEVLLRVRACGICGTDLHIHEGEFFAKFPLIPGHEFAGEVVRVGSAVESLQVGQQVVADNTEMCGTCFYCRRDQPLYCENLLAQGVNTAGGLAQYVVVKAPKVFPFKNLSWREAAMVEPTACAVHGMDIIDVEPGSDVLLFGAGPTGIVLAQLLKLNGAARLIVAAPEGRKLNLIERLCADQVVVMDRNDRSNHYKRLKEISPRGFDYVIEATGSPHVCEESIEYVRQGGELVVYGVYPEAARLSWSPYEIFRREITIKGSFAQSHCFDRALQYLESGRIKVDEVVTEEFELSDYAYALDTVRSRRGIKTIVLPA